MKVLIYLYAFAKAQRLETLESLEQSSSGGGSLSNRAYSDWPPFLVDGTAKKWWKQNENYIEKYYILEPATDLFYDHFFGANDKAQRFAKNARRWLHDVRSDFPRNVQRCDRKSKRGHSKIPTIHDRRRRDGTEVTPRGWHLPLDQGIKKGYEALFFQYARWAREEIYWDCPRIGMRIFKRLDRLRWLTIFYYCARVDDTDPLCVDTYFLNGKPKAPPRTSSWFDRYWGRESMIAYNGVACGNEDNGPTDLVMYCPRGHDIKVINAQFGRWNHHTCTQNVNKATLEMCPQYIDVFAYVNAECSKKNTCKLTVNEDSPGVLKDRNAPCPLTSKYTRIRWTCEPDDTYLQYGN